MRNELREYEKAFVDTMVSYRVSADEGNYTEGLGQLINALELAVNSYSVNYDAIIEAIKESKEGYSNLIQLSYEWIEFWSDTNENNTDPRNAASTRLCRTLAARIRESFGEIGNGTHWYTGLDRYVLSMHKTLIQSATTLFVRVLADTNSVVKDYVIMKYGTKDFRLPMI